MRQHYGTLGAMLVAGLALCATPRAADERTEEERKTPLPPPEPKPVAKNLPGETNRQFAARMKAEAEAARLSTPQQQESR